MDELLEKLLEWESNDRKALKRFATRAMEIATANAGRWSGRVRRIHRIRNGEIRSEWRLGLAAHLANYWYSGNGPSPGGRLPGQDPNRTLSQEAAAAGAALWLQEVLTAINESWRCEYILEDIAQDLVHLNRSARFWIALGETP